MKTTLLITLMCMATIGAYAQDRAAGDADRCVKYAEMPKGAAPAWPKSPYIAVQSPECAPCYTYTTKHGLAVMECPGLYFLPEHKDQGVVTETNDMGVNTVHSYTGHYPQACKRDPNMPAGAVPAWPKSEYRSTQAPGCAPCYEYTSKHGVRIMECPFALFPPEKK